MLEREDLQEFFRPAPLIERGRKLRDAYAAAEPFPHVVIDDFLPAELARDVARRIVGPAEHWVRRQRDTAVKRGNPDETSMDPAVQALLYKLNSGAFVHFLEALTGIERLIPDPHLRGGGIHLIERGGFLKIHADFNVHFDLGLDRRLNVLLYLNEDWDEDWGGHLELWDRAMKRCVRKIAPLLNRCVVFSTTSTSYHGHPEPLAAPAGRSRKSLALYYYTAGRPAEERHAPHSTLYQVPGVRPAAPPDAKPAPPWWRRIASRLRRA